MTEPNSPEPLQFDRAEPDVANQATPGTNAQSELTCCSCREPIKTHYYHVDGNLMCAKCKHTAQQAAKPQQGFGKLVKAFLGGGVAAVLGAALYYGVIAITNFEIGLVAIVIGFIVGFGVRLGAGGAGGRRYQVLALALTYFAVGLAYTPLAFKGVMDAKKTAANTFPAADSVVADSADSSSTNENTVGDSATVSLAAVAADSLPPKLAKLGWVGSMIALFLLVAGSFLMIFALPVIAVIGSLPSGLISALIIAFGMQQAWKMTAAHKASITGPYKVGGAEPPVNPEPAPTS